MTTAMDPNEIAKLLAAGKKDEAKRKLIEYLESVALSPEEQGKVYADIASLYLKTQNELMGKYTAFLDDVIGELKAFNEKEKEVRILLS